MIIQKSDKVNYIAIIDKDDYLQKMRNKFKSAMKNKTEVVLRLSSNMIGDNEINFPRKLLLTNRQVLNLRKVFANNSSTDNNYQKLNYVRWYNQEDF